MKKEKIYKALFIFAILLIWSCEETPTNINDVLEYDIINIQDNGALKIAAKIYNFEEYIPKSGFDSAFVYVKNNGYTFDNLLSVNVDREGNLLVEIPEPNQNEFEIHYPKNYISYNFDSTSSHTFVDSIKFTNSTEFTRYKFGVTIFSKDLNGDVTYTSASINKTILENYESSFPSEGDSYYLVYYFKNPTIISGFQKAIIVEPNKTREYITNYDIQVYEGWNIFECKYMEKNGNNIDGGKFVVNVINTTNNKGKWIFHGSEIFPSSIYDL